MDTNIFKGNAAACLQWPPPPTGQEQSPDAMPFGPNVICMRYGWERDP